MDEYIIKGSTLTGIGNAIRRKTGGTALIDPEDMESEIDAISGGGEQATPEIAVDENGLITATAGDKSATKQLSTQSGKTITPGPTEQIAVAAGKYITGDIIIEAVQNVGGGSGGSVGTGPNIPINTPTISLSVVGGTDPLKGTLTVSIGRTSVSVTAEDYLPTT